MRMALSTRSNHNEVFPNEEDTLEAIIDRLLPMEASESDWNHFAMFWIGNPIKFHHSVTYHNIKDLCCIRALYTATMLLIRFDFNVFPYACETRCKHPFSTLWALFLFHFQCSILELFFAFLHLSQCRTQENESIQRKMTTLFITVWHFTILRIKLAYVAAYTAKIS